MPTEREKGRRECDLWRACLPQAFIPGLSFDYYIIFSVGFNYSQLTDEESGAQTGEVTQLSSQQVVEPQSPCCFARTGHFTPGSFHSLCALHGFPPASWPPPCGWLRPASRARRPVPCCVRACARVCSQTAVSCELWRGGGSRVCRDAPSSPQASYCCCSTRPPPGCPQASLGLWGGGVILL